MVYTWLPLLTKVEGPHLDTVKVPDDYDGPHVQFPMTLKGLQAMIISFKQAKVGILGCVTIKGTSFHRYSMLTTWCWYWPKCASYYKHYPTSLWQPHTYHNKLPYVVSTSKNSYFISTLKWVCELQKKLVCIAVIKEYLQWSILKSLPSFSSTFRKQLYPKDVGLTIVLLSFQ